MTSEHRFTDYYSILQVSPDCDVSILQSAYHHLAKKYHPDRSSTADTGKFAAVIEAYRALRNPERRAEYDAAYAEHRGPQGPEGASDQENGQDAVALNDADDHTDILLFLYKKRRENAQDAGVPAYYLQEMLGCSDEHFEFHKWYLKEKGFIVMTEHGTLAITIQGVDHVISMSRTTKVEKLLLSRLDDTPD